MGRVFVENGIRSLRDGVTHSHPAHDLEGLAMPQGMQVRPFAQFSVLARRMLFQAAFDGVAANL